ncbi:hypothetical protein OBP_145 [Pseudomonas phage OBP]|uniref:hypothetical protein n=1 Tax=Pseudomonas phage OBP TaxID=1124849 RepID=UPI000240D566|nr:hypothetical protein OBP_145 [Pseudomonas phage OBP]AEV89582.1 hypothetical protein OBP_145 [Pseudomonas phage OBP]
MYVDPNKPLPPADTKEDYLGSVLNAVIDISNKRTETQGTPEEYEEKIADQQWEADQKLDAFSKWADDTLLAHTNKKGAVHGETKASVGLNLKDNWRMATIPEHEAGQAKNLFCHPFGSKKLIEARLVIDPKRYIRSRIIPIASGGQLGNVPQWPFSWEEGEITQSLDDPLEFYGETPWQFSTDNGVFLIPALNGADILTQHVADPGRPKRAVTPFGGTNIRVYNKTLDIRRSRPSLLRGESSDEPSNSLIKGSAHLFDRHTAFYCETDYIGARAFNKGRLPFDVLTNNGVTKTNWAGILESREDMLYNINTTMFNGNLSGWGDDIYLIFEIGMWQFSQTGLDSKNGSGRPAETIASLGTKVETLTFTVPGNGKFRILKRAGKLDAIAVKFRDILNYNAADKDLLWNQFNHAHFTHVAFTWRNRLKGDFALRVPVGFSSKDGAYYTNYYMDINCLIKENMATKSATVVFNTLREVDTNIQTLNANFQVTATGRFVQYAYNVKGDIFHPLVFNGTFESQGGHVKAYTFYNRQYVGYYEHNVDGVGTWIANGDNIKPTLVKYNYSQISNLNQDGMYGDHLRHIPVKANTDGTTDYLVYSRDWRHQYRWCVVNVKTDTAPEMLTSTGHHLGPWRNKVEWIKPSQSALPSFLISNEENSTVFDTSALVFNTQNAFKGFARFGVDVSNAANPVQPMDEVDIDDPILTWIANNGGRWSKSHKQMFYFKNRLFWVSQTTDVSEVKADGTDTYYGWIADCYLDVVGDKRIIKVSGALADKGVAKPLKVNLKTSLAVKSSEVTGWDAFDSTDVYTMLMSQTGSRTSYLVMMNLAPFNNFYFEFKLDIDTALATTSFAPLSTGAVDPVFPYDPTNGFQVDYDAITGYGKIAPHRFHVNFQTPVMLKKAMWAFRKTPGHYGLFSQSIGFTVAEGGVMNSIEGTPIYPVGSVVTIGGSNVVVKSPISAAQSQFGGDEELLIKQYGSSDPSLTSPDGLTLYGVKNNYGLETQPNSGISPCGFLRNNKFYHYDPNGWRHALLPVIDGKRMSFYGYGNSFPAFLGVNGSGVPVNRFFLQAQATIIQWATSEGRVIYIGSGANINIVISGETQSYAGGGTYTIPAKYTGAVDIQITGLITLKWMPGFGNLKQIGNTVTRLDFSESTQFTITSPLPSRITSLRGTFRNAKGAQYPNIESWDTKNITDMAECFQGATVFNGNLTNWNTSAVTTMEGMFDGAAAFNQAIGKWNVQRVETMGKMFRGATGFKADLSTWNITRCAVFAEMFKGASNFNGNISTWNVLTCYDFTSMFEDTNLFNGDISKWIITGATRFSKMFKNAKAFNGAINIWDMSSAIYMDEMFSGASAFNRTLANWNTSKVITTREMFYNATNFGKDAAFVLSAWDMRLNLDLTRMFANSGFNCKVDGWSFGKDASLYEMFLGTKTFNQDISSWDVGNVDDFSGMFKQSTAFKTIISNWVLASVSKMSGMFTASSFSGDLIDWNISSTKDIMMDGVFADAPFFNGAGIATWNTSKVTTMARMFANAVIFNRDITGWDTSKVTTFFEMFLNAKAFNQAIGVWDVSSGTIFRNMLRLAITFDQDLDNWNMSNATDISDIFREAAAFNGKVGAWDTSNVIAMNGTFVSCPKFNQDISGWNVSKVENFVGMFGSTLVFNQDISGWNTSSATTMEGMFNAAKAFNQDLSGWNVANVTNHTNFDVGATAWVLPRPNFV